MKIVVCIKQVPDTKGGVKFNPDGTLDRGAMLTIMNPDDKAGLEAALRLKDQYGAEVTVVTMGLPKAEEVLREAGKREVTTCGISAKLAQKRISNSKKPEIGYQTAWFSLFWYPFFRIN